jgi:PKD repeat protein
VDFTDRSMGDYDAYLWEFGDEMTSTLPNPTHIYATTGTYTVTLTINRQGGSSVLSRTHLIAVYTPVQAGFALLPTFGMAPLSVVFTNTSTGDYATSLWSFGDNTTSMLKDPTHTSV